jgi:prepilin-type N-terminal cleavage/methylation domain-containing protein
VTGNRQRGFSLLEVLVALLILTLVIMTTLAIFLEHNRRIRQANEIILAYQALANEAEIQRRVDFDNLKDEPFESETNILKPLAPFTADVVVTDRRQNIKDVTMTITWRAGAKKAVLSMPRVNTGGSNLW